MMTTEHKSALINRITALKSSGLSQQKIADTLNEEQLKTPTGRDWTGVLVGSFAHRMNIFAAAKTNGEEQETTMPKKKVSRKLKARTTRSHERDEQAVLTAPTAQDSTVDSIRAVVNSNMTDGEKIRVISRFL
jgi:hypothetical protein